MKVAQSPLNQWWLSVEIQQARSCAQASFILTMVPKAQTNQKLNYKQVKKLEAILNKLKQAGYQEQQQEQLISSSDQKSNNKLE